MAHLNNRISLSVGDMEKMLGANKLSGIIRLSERTFFSRVDEITLDILRKEKVRIIFISGPTASGKTTFSERMVSQIQSQGRPAFCLSLDNYYQIPKPIFDEDGRPDLESIGTLDIPMIIKDISDLLQGEEVRLSKYEFQSGGIRTQADTGTRISKDTLLVVEGLHGLAPEISGVFSREILAGIFIMPWGSVVASRRLLESRDIRLLRRISRDSRHRSAGALATIDYWPMVIASEQHCFGVYLRRADYYMNTMLDYELLITARIACMDIKEDLRRYAEGELPASALIMSYCSDRNFADLERALERARQLTNVLEKFPHCNPMLIPEESILHEFI